MNQAKSLHYLTETDKDFITDTMTTLIGQKTSPTNKTEQRIGQTKFYRELQIDNDYCFGNPSELSKKSKKLIKSLQKQQKSFDTTHKEDQAEESREMTPFQIESEISSISYAVEQSTPCDSVFSKIIKQNQNSKTQSEQFQDEGSCGSQCGIGYGEKSQVQQEQNTPMVQNPQISQTSQDNARQCPIQTFDTQANDIQQLPVAQQPVVQYVPKQSALQFKDYNSYVRNYLKKRPLDVIIHPEYSAYVQDCSQLAVQGRLMMLQANKRLMPSYNVRPRKRVTPDPNSFLDQIFGKGVRPQYHEEEGEKREKSDQKQTDK